ncbi:MAG: hypothetical protein SNF33_03930 [Candidatus Algichlamydia australiensis]|nr:hypothetical protein [Chlamydiales bacterium]
MKKFKASILFVCLFLFGATSCNNTQQQPTQKMSQPTEQGQQHPNCPKEDPCDPCA